MSDQTKPGYFYEQSEILKVNSVNHSIDYCIPWLYENKLMKPAEELKIRNGKKFSEAEKLLYGLSTRRAEKKTKSEIDLILKNYKDISNKVSKKQMEEVWMQLKQPKSFHFFDVNKISPDALAFYRPFHFYNHDDWGIYLLADKIMEYYNRLRKKLGKNSIFFQSDILLGYIIFEIFHHEFFHHIVESAATSLEIISAGFGKPKPLYIEYFYSKYHEDSGLGQHKHDPLEEALANAYAYNSFSFSSRVNKGYKSILVKAYQEALLKDWRNAPPGYCNADNYINSGYIKGATQLMAMIMNSSLIDPLPSSIVAKNVLLNGHAAFCAKPDIPTYIVGSESALEHFYNLIPAPNATYTNLFWHEELSEIDKFIELKKKQEKTKKDDSIKKSLRG